MAMSVKEFLLLYFRQRHFNEMPDAVRARFDDYAKNDDFVGDMKSWKRDLMESDGSNKSLPDAKKELDDSGWESLFRSFQNAFIGMSAARESFKDKTAITEFLDKYFGDKTTHLFSLPELHSSIIAPLNSFISTIVKDKDGFALLGDMFNYDYDEYKDFVDSMDKGEYKTKPDVRKKLNRVISSLSRRLEWGDITNDKLKTKLESLDLNTIIEGFNEENTVDPAKLKAFKEEYQTILNTLHDNPKIYEEFKKHDNEKISKYLDQAIEKTDYTGKVNEKDFVSEKREDVSNWRQRYEKWKKNTYKDVFRKFMTAHHDRIFFNVYAKNIFDALDAKGINPTDGIDGILKGADIVGKLKIKSPTAAAHFEWFTKTMGILKDTIPDAYEGALRNGEQMNHLVSEMATIAVDQVKDGTDKDAVKKAKTAMEVLMTMRYGLFTSRTMNAINETDFTIFSDKELSWNKNEGIQFVTKAFDKTLKFGVQLVGYAATAAVNLYRRKGTSFNHSGELQDKVAEWEAENTSNKANADAERRRLNKANRKEKKALLTHKKGLKAAILTALGKPAGSSFRLTEAEKYLRTQRKAEDTKRADRDTQKTITDTAESKYKKELAVNEDYNTIDSAQLEVKKQQKVIDGLEIELKALPTPAPDKYQEAIADAKKQEWEAARAELKRLSDKLANTTKDIDDKYAAAGTTLAAEYKRVNTVPTGKTKTPLQEAFDNFKVEEAKLTPMQTALETLENDNNTLEQQILEYKSDTESIKGINATIKSMDDNFKKWDENHKNDYLELMAFWDYIQTGNARNLFRFSKRKLIQLSTKSVQKEMDEKQASGKTKMEELYAQWKQQHSY